MSPILTFPACFFEPSEIYKFVFVSLHTHKRNKNFSNRFKSFLRSFLQPSAFVIIVHEFASDSKTAKFDWTFLQVTRYNARTRNHLKTEILRRVAFFTYDTRRNNPTRTVDTYCARLGNLQENHKVLTFLFHFTWSTSSLKTDRYIRYIIIRYIRPRHEGSKREQHIAPTLGSATLKFWTFEHIRIK